MHYSKHYTLHSTDNTQHTTHQHLRLDRVHGIGQAVVRISHVTTTVIVIHFQTVAAALGLLLRLQLPVVCVVCGVVWCVVMCVVKCVEPRYVACTISSKCQHYFNGRQDTHK